MKKRAYTAPVIERVPLVTEEACLTACKVGTVKNTPGNEGCNNVWSCNQPGS